MRILFVHQNFPAQFGHIAAYLSKNAGIECAFLNEKRDGTVAGVRCIKYAPQGGATEHNHYCTRTFENATRHAYGCFERMKALPDYRPDLIVGHSGFGSTLFLRELYGNTPIINYFEYFYRPVGSDMDFRPDYPSKEIDRVRARARNAMILLDLDNCNVGYSPTNWQRERFPAEYLGKIRPIFDGVDTSVWRPQDVSDRIIDKKPIPAGMKIVTYATRGMESMRGFDLFLKAAKTIADRRSDVLFVIAGQERVCYGGDERFTEGKTFKEWCFSKDDYDLSRFLFLGLIPPPELAKLFSLSDCHVYLTVPFVLSWSLLNALACGSRIVASDTEPVREMIEHGRNGLLVDFFDVAGFATAIEQVIDHPDHFRPMGTNGIARIRDQYSLDVCLPQMLQLYQDAVR
jgi:glycosyltransferase involved in cell wall biosynthesis